MKIAFIGGGNMASALIGGLIRRGVAAADLSAIDPSDDARARVAQQFGIQARPVADATLAQHDAIVLAVKPQVARAVAEALAAHLAAHQLVISIVAGIRCADLSRWLGGHARIVRAMPNTPALIGLGITGLFAHGDASSVRDVSGASGASGVGSASGVDGVSGVDGISAVGGISGVNAAGRALASDVLGAVGETVWVDDEAKIDAVTAISGSGPAYVFYFIEALEEAARRLGMNAQQGRTLALATLSGAAQLALQSNESPSVLRERVTSKGGTTAAALASFDASNVKEAIVRGALAANARAREMGEESGRQ